MAGLLTRGYVRKRGWLSLIALLAAQSAPALTAQDVPAPRETPPPQLEMVKRYLEAFNTGRPERLAPVIAEFYAPPFLEDFGGARAAAWDRIELFRTYGPLEIRHVDAEAQPPIVWSIGTVTGGWVGHQLHLADGEPGRVVRHTTWRARPVPYPRRELPDAEVADSMRAWLGRLAHEGLFSGSVTMSRHGEQVLSVSHGGDGHSPMPRPVGPGTRFHVASVTKLLTVIALLQLVEAGEVALDEPLARWIPEYPRPWRDDVTVRHLLTHTSGIELDEDPAFLEKVRVSRSADELLAAQIEHLAGQELRFAPGTEYDYTSEGIDLAGVIVERAASRPWMEVVRDRVLGPAGMEHTRFTRPEEEGRWALGFTSLNADLQSTTPGALRPATDVLTVVAKPSSGAWSTAEDLHRLMRALLDHRLLGPAWTDSLLTPQRVTAELPKYGIVSWVGLGAQGEDLFGVRTVGHGGVVPGYSAAIEYLPENGWLLAVVSNTGEATGFLVFQRFLELTGHAGRPMDRDLDSGEEERAGERLDR
ncbi:MAG TPA: serine hydrolase domain-containing protein, partial [Longimicrobiaceae bacterium]|nr:serine hydrolase domain-containing protein [Longimicrobiaceae bacterium]